MSLRSIFTLGYGRYALPGLWIVAAFYGHKINSDFEHPTLRDSSIAMFLPDTNNRIIIAEFNISSTTAENTTNTKKCLPKGKHTTNLSGRQDSNLRPPGPKPGALPGCATPRLHLANAKVLIISRMHKFLVNKIGKFGQSPVSPFNANRSFSAHRVGGRLRPSRLH